jgi:alpha-beta hydrolase superfamily lysophospholipase
MAPARIKTPWERLRGWILVLAWVVLVVVVIAVVLFRHAAIPPEPGAFYTPPNPLPMGAPGTILRREPITDGVPDGAVSWRILYLSTGVNGERIAVSGVVVAPAGASASPRPVIAWARGTVGVLPACGLSHTSEPFRKMPALDLMVRRGFVVATTDYPGLGTPGIHPYLVGPVEADSVLDSVRAARQLDVGAGDRFAVWGASQGGHASLWTAQSAGAYAPELKLIGAAASAPATDLEGILAANLHSPSGGVYTAELLYSWSHVYPGAELDDIVRPGQRAQFEKMATTCVSTPLAFLTLGGLLTPSDYLAVDHLTEPWKTWVARNTPRGRIDVPLLITHGAADNLVPIALSEAETARRCEQGESVTLVSLPGVGHDSAEESGLLVVGWIEDRFAGRPVGTTCGG